MYIRKFCGNTLREKQYLVNLNEIYLASANYTSSHKASLDNKEEENGVMVNSLGNSNDDINNVNDQDADKSSGFRRYTRSSNTRMVSNGDSRYSISYMKSSK